MDFKSLLDSDMEVFHNAAEFAQKISVWYQEEHYTLPVIIDHTAAEERQKAGEDHAEGIYRADCLAYIPMRELGFVPKKDRRIELEVAGAVNTYNIAKADCEDGEIILELELMEE